MSKTPKANNSANTDVPAVVGASKTDVSTEVFDYGDDAGKGMEDVKKEELRLPFIRILQSNSPVIVDQTIPNARIGMIHNTATNELFDGLAGVRFVPVFRDHTFIEYVPRDNGGGFVAQWDPNDKRIPKLQAEQSKYGRLAVDGGNELVESFNLYGIAIIDDMPINCLLGFSSTQIKKYQSVTTRLNNISYKVKKPDGSLGLVTPPIWAHYWVLRTQQEQNKKGKFWGWNIAPLSEPINTCRLNPQDPYYLRAKDFYTAIKAGAVKVDYNQSDAPAEDTVGDTPF